MTIKEVIAQLDEAISATWTEYQTVGLALLGLIGLIVLAVAAAVARKRETPIKPTVIFLGSNLALLLNAEGMWEVLTDPEKADVPKGFAVLVFAVFEICLMIAMDQARSNYNRTAVRHLADGTDEQGRQHKAGEIKRPGDAGRALWVVWFIALLSGSVVATNGGSATVVIMRLGLPVMVVLMWWITLTAEGARARRRSTFKYHPYRVAVRRGWVEPVDNEDQADEQLRLQAAKANEQKMVTFGHRLESGAPGAWWWKRRLSSLAREADEDTLNRVAGQVQLVTSAVSRIAPSTSTAAKTERASTPSTAPAHALTSAPSAPVPALTSTPSTPSTPSAPDQHTSSAPARVLEASTPVHVLTPVHALTPAPDPVPEDVLTEQYPTTDTGLIGMLQRAARDGDGTLAVRAAQRLLTAPGSDKQCGPERARRLLTAAGLYTAPVARINGAEVPELVAGA